MNVAVLISGGGTTLRNLLEKKAAGQLDLDISLVISSSPDAAGLNHAHQASIPTAIVDRSDCDTAEAGVPV